MEGAHLLCHVMTLREKNNKTNEKFVIGSPNVSTKGVESLMGKTGRSALQPMSLNAGLTGLVPSLESKASRQLRSVKRAVGTFKAKMKPSGRKCQSTKRRLLDMTVSATPQTPEGVLRLVQSPLPNSAFATPRNTRRYRDTAQMLTPYSPLEGLRRSERIASRTPTPMKYAPRSSTRRHQPRRLQTPGRFEGELDSVTARINVLAQSMKVFESMETGITKTIARQESNNSVTEIKVESKDGEAKKALRGKRTSSLTSLKESLQKRLKKQPSDANMEGTREETTEEETQKRKRTNDKTSKEESAQENEGTVKKMQKRQSSLSNVKEDLRRSIKPRKGQHPKEKVIKENEDEGESENVPLIL
ncbi:uncharacterized protein [Asterias amurensis]|uniref:uncharacterized protein n=1 Tax=Asterias amurensis TaxID=7602 RepID=UPI003AB83CBD